MLGGQPGIRSSSVLINFSEATKNSSKSLTAAACKEQHTNKIFQKPIGRSTTDKATAAWRPLLQSCSFPCFHCWVYPAVGWGEQDGGFGWRETAKRGGRRSSAGVCPCVRHQVLTHSSGVSFCHSSRDPAINHTRYPRLFGFVGKRKMFVKRDKKKNWFKSSAQRDLAATIHEAQCDACIVHRPLTLPLTHAEKEAIDQKSTDSCMFGVSEWGH